MKEKQFESEESVLGEAVDSFIFRQQNVGKEGKGIEEEEEDGVVVEQRNAYALW